MADRSTYPNIVKETWRAYGREIRPLRGMVYLRTELRDAYTAGGIYIPPEHRGNFKGLANRVYLTGIVLAAGPECRSVVPGDRVAINRLHFGWLEKFEDGTLLGYLLDEQFVFGYWDCPNPPAIGPEAAERAH